MSYNFKRKYILTIEDIPEIKQSTDQSVSTNSKIENTSADTVKEDDLSSVTSRGTIITDLHIEADIYFNSKTKGSDSGKSTIKIFNLSEETINRISKKNARVILEAGYEGFIHTVFTGQVSDFYTTRNSQDIVTVLSVSDGWSPLNSVRYSKSFGRDSLYSDILRDLVNTFSANGITPSSKGIILDVASGNSKPPSELKVERSWSFSGFLRDAMDSICEEVEYTWQIVNSRLFVYPKDTQDVFGVTELSPANILSVRRQQEGNRTVSSEPETSGVQIKILLDGRVKITERVKILRDDNNQSSTVNKYQGEYVIVSVRHRLSYEGESWHTEIKCQGVE